jgi:hypothetical protein
MFKNIFLLVGIFIILSSSNVYSDESRNGNWWRSLQIEQKCHYLIGILDGLDLAVTFLYMDEREDQKITREVIVLKELNQQKYLKNVTYEQLIDGLNDFFSDFKNRNIETNMGIFIVLKMIRGDSEDEINTMVKNLRRLPVEKENVLRELREKNK